jgi:hypothetical protein
MPSAFARSLRAAALALFLAACLGCYPGIAWLPDSSGFVYSGGEDGKQLLLFDLKKKASRVLVEDAGGPAWPAVSPDGKRIAVAIKDLHKRHVWLTVSVFDRAGKLTHRSKKLQWREYYVGKWFGGDDIGGLPQVAWSPRGDRLLLSESVRTALYDLKTGKLLPIDGSLVTVGNTPVRPDGKGFLTVGPKGFQFVGFDGTGRPIKGKLPKIPVWRGEMSFFFPSRWEGATALLCWPAEPSGDDLRLLRLDTEKLTGASEEGPRPPKKDGEFVLKTWSFPGGVSVREVSLPQKKGQDHVRLELVRGKGKAAEVLVKPKTNYRFHFFPSPDRKWLAVGWEEEKGDGRPVEPSDRRLLVLDAVGKVIARLGAER